MLSRRSALVASLLALSIGWACGAASQEGEPEVGDDGLYKQDFFLESFLELGPDLDEAAAEGRGLMVLFEQRGCPYCRELHRINFARPAILAALEADWRVVQLDLWGSREVTDFDGETMEERELARKWAISFTPTTVLFPPESAGAPDRTAAEAFRMPGYFKPFHYLAGLDYAASDDWRETPFQRFLQQRFEALEAQGIEPDVW